jgi:uncharacterized protein DUF1275
MKLISTDTHVETTVAMCLSLIAGYLDGYGLLVLGTYVSFMSGNTTFTGLKIGQGHFDAALPSAIAVASFVSGTNNKVSGNTRQTLWVQPCGLSETMRTVRTRSGLLQDCLGKGTQTPSPSPDPNPC